MPRLVLDVVDIERAGSPTPGVGRPWDMLMWARHSTSSWGGPVIQKDVGYVQLPPLPAPGLVTTPQKRQLGKKIRDTITLCEQFLRPPQGNRSCFNKCN